MSDFVCKEHNYDTIEGTEPCPYCSIEIYSYALDLACEHIFKVAQAGPTSPDGWRQKYILQSKAEMK
jgi:hypothetical protein